MRTWTLDTIHWDMKDIESLKNILEKKGFKVKLHEYYRTMDVTI